MPGALVPVPETDSLEGLNGELEQRCREDLSRKLRGKSATKEGLLAEERSWLLAILIGNPGTGKTHIATALAVEACGRGKRIRFWKVTELVTHLIEARQERQLARMKGQLAKLDLLVLDELGYVPTSKRGAELLFDVISTAYERTSLIVTTNLPSENWTEVLGSERLTGAVLDRLTHRCQILEATGESYRLQDARRRRGVGRKSK